MNLKITAMNYFVRRTKNYYLEATKNALNTVVTRNNYRWHGVFISDTVK